MTPPPLASIWGRQLLSNRHTGEDHLRILATLPTMALTEHVPLAEVKNRLSEVVERIEREHGRVVITKHGRPAAVIVSIEDLRSLEETLEILGDPELLAQIREAEADVGAGRTETLSKDQALSVVHDR
jgi:antitoxin YefM